MLLYILTATAALAMFPLCRGGKSRFFCCAAAFAVLLAVAALRWNTGYDYGEYASLYRALPRLAQDELAALSFEKGFLLPASWLAAFFPDYHALFFAAAAITALAVTCFAYKYSSNPAVSIFMLLVTGLYFNSFNFIRQFLAALVVLYALRYIGEGRLLRFAAYILFACTLHSSAVIMLLFYFVLKIKPTYITAVLYIAATVLLYIYSDELLSFATRYIYSGYSENYELSNGLPLACTIAFGALTALAFLLRKMLLLREKNNAILINCMFFAFFFELIGTKHAVVSRLSIYFLLPAALLLLPEIFEVLHLLIKLTFRQKRQYLIAAGTAAVVVVALCGWFYVCLLSDNYNGVVPYTTVFEEAANAYSQT